MQQTQTGIVGNMQTSAAKNDIQLYCGDCIEMMQQLENKSVQMILTDLPFGITKNKWDEIIPLDELWRQFNRIITGNGVIALWAQEPFTSKLIMSNPKMFRYKWIVEKTNATGFLNANRMPMKAYEEVLIFYQHLPVYHPQKTTGHPRKVSSAEHKRNSKKSTNYNDYANASYDSTERFPRDVITFTWDKQKLTVHPTQKPVAALEYFIKTYTDEGDIVLDATMGSGSTGVACCNLNRKFIGIERDEEYYEIAKTRIFSL